MSRLPHLVLEEQPTNMLAGAEGSCEDTKKILVLSVEHLTIIMNWIFIGIY